MDEEEALKMGQKLVKGEFDLEDFRDQLQQLKKMQKRKNQQLT